jgi:hypothetical protein
MSTLSPTTHRTLRILPAICAALSLLAAGVAVAGQGNGQRPGKPRWESKQVQQQRTPTGHERNTTWTGANGKTATRNADVSFDRDAGTRTREVTTTGPNGAVRTVSDVTTHTDDGYARETVVTNPNGGTVTREATGSYDADTKTWTTSVSVDRDPPAND